MEFFTSKVCIASMRYDEIMEKASLVLGRSFTADYSFDPINSFILSMRYILSYTEIIGIHSFFKRYAKTYKSIYDCFRVIILGKSLKNDQDLKKMMNTQTNKFLSEFYQIIKINPKYLQNVNLEFKCCRYLSYLVIYIY